MNTVKYIVFKDKKGNVVSVAEENVINDETGVIAMEVMTPPNLTKHQIDHEEYKKHVKTLAGQ